MTIGSRILFFPRAIIIAFLVTCDAWALEPFTVSDIRVEGIQRIEAGTVFNYLPIKVGDRIDEKISRDSIEILFSTGFFNDVELKQDGQVLVVIVTERPSIASIEYSGNKDIRDEAIEEALTSTGFTEGQIFNQPLLERLVQTIRERYFSTGRYSATVVPTVTPLERNRVSINLQIDEGQVAKIRKLRIIGNASFEDGELLDLLDLGEDSWLSFLSSSSKYSKEKLNASLESIRSHYLDRGYMTFEIESSDVAISQNKQDIFLTITIVEGDLYRIGQVGLEDVGGILREGLFEEYKPRSGTPFSRKTVIETRTKLEESLADDGFAFANVNAIPETDEENKTVDFTFVVDPGPLVYVRRINIRGNSSTRDEVIRREMRQLEGSEFSASNIRRSKERIRRLGYFDDVNMDIATVPGTVDQVDVDVTVSERATGNFLFGVGYSGSDGLILQAEVNRENLFGSGRQVKLKIDHSDVNKFYELGYTNPYFTPDGISLGIFAELEDIDTAEATSADYVSDTVGVGAKSRIPISEHNAFHLRAGFEQIELEATESTPSEYSSFIDRFPESDNFTLTAGVTRDTRDSIFFPAKGYLRRASAEFAFPGSDLEYYKLTLRGRWYRSVTDNLVISFKGNVGYGDGYGDTSELPFFKNYYAGGPGTVRGYDSRSLGPRSIDSANDTLGGTKRIIASTELVFPVPGMKDSRDQRLSLFFDAGQVFGDDESVHLEDLRYGAGIGFNWFSPVGPLSLSYAMPFNDETGDDLEKLQFTLGALFR